MHKESNATKRADIRPADHDERMKAASERAQWELGDRTWAGVIVGAYLWPDDDKRALAAEITSYERSSQESPNT